MTSIADRWLVRTTNTAIVATNFQEFGIETMSTSPVEDPVTVAQIIAYLVSCAQGAIAVDTQLTAVYLEAAGTTGFVPQPFPIPEWAALVAENPGLGAAVSYPGLVIGTGNMAPLGTSIVVTEYSAGGGPGSRGRHFLPFVNTLCLEAHTGFLNDANKAAIGAAYEAYILNGDGGLGSVALHPCIINAAGTTQTPVTHEIVQPVLSNLRSRRR